MKSVSMVLAIALMASVLLSGCVVVPLDGWHGYGYGYGPGPGRGGYHHRSVPYPYRGR
jgi:hypothetical protein